MGNRQHCRRITKAQNKASNGDVRRTLAIEKYRYVLQIDSLRGERSITWWRHNRQLVIEAGREQDAKDRTTTGVIRAQIATPGATRTHLVSVNYTTVVDRKWFRKYFT
jgi:hypothetical protein